jgi:hypothetical protein
VIALLVEREKALWQERYWVLAQKSKDPFEAFNEYRSESEDSEPKRTVQELPPEEQDWFRAT